MSLNNTSTIFITTKCQIKGVISNSLVLLYLIENLLSQTKLNFELEHELINLKYCLKNTLKLIEENKDEQ